MTGKMPRSELEKLIVYESPPNPFHPPGSYPGQEMFVLNDMVIKGSPRFMVAWFTGPWDKSRIYKPHCHSCDEVIMFLGSDPQNPRDLGGEIEYWIQDEKFLITKSCILYMPKMVVHAPMWPKRVDDPKKPILFVGSVAGTDISYYSRNPKFRDFADPPAGSEVGWID